MPLGEAVEKPLRGLPTASLGPIGPSVKAPEDRRFGRAVRKNAGAPAAPHRSLTVGASASQRKIRSSRSCGTGGGAGGV